MLEMSDCLECMILFTTEMICISARSIYDLMETAARSMRDYNEFICIMRSGEVHSLQSYYSLSVSYSWISYLSC